jgi:hypothetical protein
LFSHSNGGLQLDAVPLPVIEGEAIALVAFLARNRETGSGIEPTAEEADGTFVRREFQLSV